MKNKPIQQRASFEMIRYANCWEDADILIKALDIQPDSYCLSIASGGDNAFAILAQGPALVTAVDLSLPQLAVVELKKACIETFEYEQILSFLGISLCGFDLERMDLYRKIQNKLSPRSQNYFDQNPELIENGIIHQGKFENYFHMFRRRILPLIHSKKVIFELFSEKDLLSRQDFYNKKWDTWRWRMLFKLFFNRFVMGRLGRDKEFFTYADTDHFSEKLTQKTQYALTCLEPVKNPYLKYILTGNYDRTTLPYYLRKENIESIKNNLDKLRIVHSSLNNALTDDGPAYNRFNLSDIFEYMGSDLFAETAGKIVDHAPAGSKLAYWNMLVDRKISAIYPDTVKFLEDLSQDLFNQDKAFFYKAFFAEEVV